MAGPFFERLRCYYCEIGRVLRGEANVAAIFPNMTDVGQSRERVYAEFLRHHAPSKCNVFLGGFLFGEAGEESRQLDVIVTTDTTPRFDFHNRDGKGKSFAPVEGTLGVASIKSRLDKKELEDSLKGLASIPPTRSLQGRVSFGVSINNYEDWPFNIIYASDGIAAPTLRSHMEVYYKRRPEIPSSRQPHLIHVAGKYVLLRVTAGIKYWSKETGKLPANPGSFHIIEEAPDIQGLVWAVHGLQWRAAASTHINFSYGDLFDKLNGIV